MGHGCATETCHLNFHNFKLLSQIIMIQELSFVEKNHDVYESCLLRELAVVGQICCLDGNIWSNVLLEWRKAYSSSSYLRVCPINSILSK